VKSDSLKTKTASSDRFSDQTEDKKTELIKRGTIHQSSENNQVKMEENILK
jgi:hypothetical protein